MLNITNDLAAICRKITTPRTYFLIIFLIIAILINTKDLGSYTLQHAGVEAIGERNTFIVSGSTTEQLKKIGDVFHHKDQVFAAKQPGTFLLGGTVYSLLKFTGLSYKNNYFLVAGLISLLTSGILLSLASVYLFKTINFSYSQDLAFLVSFACIFGTNLIAYCSIPHHDLSASCLIIFAIYHLEKYRLTNTKNSLIFSGLLIGIVPFFSMLSATVIPALFCYCLYLCRSDSKKIPFFILSVIIGLCPFFLYNWYYFSNPFLPPNVVGNFSDTFFKLDYANFVSHLTTYFSLNKLSIIQYQPIIIVGFIGLFLIKNTPLKVCSFTAIFIHLFYILNINTIGDSQWGPRYFMPILPFLCLGLSGFESLKHKKVFLIMILFTLFYSILVNLIGALGGTMYFNLNTFGVFYYLTEPTRLLNQHPFIQYSTLGLFVVLITILPKSIPLKIEELIRENKIYFLALFFSISVGILYYLCCKNTSSEFDYTFRVAKNFLTGQIGITEKPPSYLNEMVPFNSKYYSVFPLGSVLTMLPFAILEKFNIIKNYPSAIIIGIIGFLTSWYTLKIGTVFNQRMSKRVIVSLFILFGTWNWGNLIFSGSWQIAIGVAVFSQIAALYYLLAGRYFYSGIFFSIAFGNRTELLACLPIFLFLIYNQEQKNKLNFISFLITPLILLFLTAIYNYLRFDSFTDFGYARIPGVLSEPWYKNGIFSVTAIYENFKQMLLVLFKVKQDFPYLVPTGFGGSILLMSPYLLIGIRKLFAKNTINYCCVAAIIIITTILWTHGNPGGWQVSYRYAAIMLPWIVIAIYNDKNKNIYLSEIILLIFSILINLYALYIFNFTQYI